MKRPINNAKHRKTLLEVLTILDISLRLLAPIQQQLVTPPEHPTQSIPSVLEERCLLDDNRIGLTSK